MSRHGHPLSTTAHLPKKGYQTAERHARATSSRNQWWPETERQLRPPDPPSPTSTVSSRTYQAVDSCYQEFPAYAQPRDLAAQPTYAKPIYLPPHTQFKQSIRRTSGPSSHHSGQNHQYPQETNLIHVDPQPPIANSNPQRGTLPRSLTRQSNTLTPVSCVTPTDGIVDPCGARCIEFEYFCKHFLQVLYAAAIVVGLFLTVVGSNNVFKGDYSVFVYIGVLLVLVFSFLLTIQCRVKLKPRRPARRIPEFPMRKIPSAVTESIPLQNLAGSGSTIHANQPQMVPSSSTLQHDPLLRPNTLGRASQREEDGVPWWRYQNPRC